MGIAHPIAERNLQAAARLLPGSPRDRSTSSPGPLACAPSSSRSSGWPAPCVRCIIARWSSDTPSRWPGENPSDHLRRIEDVLHSAVLQLRQYLEPELRSFIGRGPQPENFHLASQRDACGDTDSAALHSPLLAHLYVQH